MAKKNINNFMQEHAYCPFYASADNSGVYIIAIPSNKKNGKYVDIDGHFFIIDISADEKEGYNLYENLEEFLSENNLIKYQKTFKNHKKCTAKIDINKYVEG